MPEFSGSESTSWVGELEWPQEIASLFEVGANGEDFVNQVFHAVDTIFAKVILDKLIVGKRNALLVNLSVTSLVDEFTNGFEVRISVGNVRVDNCQHLLGSLGQLDENTVVDL